MTFLSDALGRGVRMRVCTNAVKSVDHRGGFDAYLIKAKESELSQKAVLLKRAIEKRPRPLRPPQSASRKRRLRKVCAGSV